MKLLRGRPATTFFSAASQAVRSRAASVPGFGTVVAKVGGTMMTTGTSAGNVLTISASAAISGNVRPHVGGQGRRRIPGPADFLELARRPDVLIADTETGRSRPRQQAEMTADKTRSRENSIMDVPRCRNLDVGRAQRRIEIVGSCTRTGGKRSRIGKRRNEISGRRSRRRAGIAPAAAVRCLRVDGSSRCARRRRSLYSELAIAMKQVAMQN